MFLLNNDIRGFREAGKQTAFRLFCLAETNLKPRMKSLAAQELTCGSRNLIENSKKQTSVPKYPLST
jgi:hypothetical protein